MVHTTEFSGKSVCMDPYFYLRVHTPEFPCFFPRKVRKNALPNGVATGKKRTFARPVGRWKTAGARRYMHRHFVI
jgi:hypothetical protein